MFLSLLFSGHAKSHTRANVLSQFLIKRKSLRVNGKSVWGIKCELKCRECFQMFSVDLFSCALAWSRHSRSHWFNACALSAQAHGSHSMTFHAGIKECLRDKASKASCLQKILQAQAGDRSKMPTLCSTSDCFATGWDNQDDKNPAMKASPAPVASTTPWMRTACCKQRKPEHPSRIRDLKVYVPNPTCQLEAGLLGRHIDRGHIVPIHCASMSPLSNDLRTPCTSNSGSDFIRQFKVFTKNAKAGCWRAAKACSKTMTALRLHMKLPKAATIISLGYLLHLGPSLFRSALGSCISLVPHDSIESWFVGSRAEQEWNGPYQDKGLHKCVPLRRHLPWIHRLKSMWFTHRPDTVEQSCFDTSHIS